MYKCICTDEERHGIVSKERRGKSSTQYSRCSKEDHKEGESDVSTLAGDPEGVLESCAGTSITLVVISYQGGVERANTPRCQPYIRLMSVLSYSTCKGSKAQDLTPSALLNRWLSHEESSTE